MIPLLVLDYCFVRNTQDEDILTLLVGRLYASRSVFACPVNMKGRDPVAIAKLSDFIKANGLIRFVYKCDQERALEALSQSVMGDVAMPELVEEAARRVGRSASPVDTVDVRIAVPGNSAVGKSQSNRKAERDGRRSSSYHQSCLGSPHWCTDPQQSCLDALDCCSLR